MYLVTVVVMHLDLIFQVSGKGLLWLFQCSYGKYFFHQSSELCCAFTPSNVTKLVGNWSFGSKIFFVPSVL